MTCAERRDAIFLQLIGGLEAEEGAVLDVHVAGCETCQAERAAAEALLAELSLDLDPVRPSAAAKQRLMARVAGPVRGAAPPPGRGGWRTVLAAGLAALAAAALAAGLATRLGTAPARERADAAESARAALEAAQRELVEERDALRAERDELQELLDEQDEEMMALEAQLDEAREVLAVLRQPDVEAVVLAGTGAQPDASARVYWEWDDYACYLHATGLERPEPGHTYALWLDTRAEGTIRVGTFAPDGTGEATFFAKLPNRELQVSRAFVTDEPSEPGEEPGGAVLLEWRRPPAS